jgi:alpha-galactosidase
LLHWKDHLFRRRRAAEIASAQLHVVLRGSSRSKLNQGDTLRIDSFSLRLLGLCFVGLLTSFALRAQTASLASTPPMGWNSWNHFGHSVNAADVRAAADALVSSGMRDEGYIYVNIDDTWEGERDAQGVLHSNSKFPDMKALADYVHSKGLKLGIYSSPGPNTCAKFAGSYGHEQQDADTFAQWGIDYLKYDLCGFRTMLQDAHDDPILRQSMMEKAYEKMHQALLHTHRPIVYSICQYGEEAVWEWGAKVGGNLWRTTGDVNDTYDRMTLIGFGQAGLAKYAGPGHWNDPDMLEIGNGKMTADEYRTQMSLWSLLAAPLLAGNDLTQMDDVTKSILMNKAVIAVDQDPLGVQGDRVRETGPFEIWSKPLRGGDVAVGLFNRSNTPYPMTLRLKDVGITGAVHASDVWSQKDLGRLRGSYTATVPRHGVVMLILSRKDR